MFEFDAHHKINHHGYAGEQDAAGHAFAVEHQEEREIDQGRPCFFLGYDEEHGEQDYSAGRRKIFPSLDIKVISAHEFCYG